MWKSLKVILIEGIAVAVIGSILSFAANAISPRGLGLARDYFPGSKLKPVPVATGGATASNAAPAVASISPAQALAARLKAKGLHLADSNQVTQLFRDPRYDQELVIFVDARDDQHYQAGHIPGAYQFDHYRPENYIATVLPACQLAEQVVVYCTGGECEDSEFTAVTLGGAGIPAEKLFVYGGGMNEWATNGLPVELGMRKSGQFRNSTP